MAITTIGEFASALSSLVDNNENIGMLTFPIDFKDPIADDMEKINTYNTYLANGDYATASTYRSEHPELESYIYDANKMNFLQTLVLTVQAAEGTRYDNSESGLEANNAQDAIDELSATVNECFQSVSDGKALIASAITDKRIATDATATFEEMANNIGQIVLGSGNAVVADVLSGKTFTNDDGVEYTGTMPNRGALTPSIGNTGTYTIPLGYHNGNGIVDTETLRKNVMNALANAGLGVTTNTSWTTLISKAKSVFPAQTNALSSWSSASKWTTVEKTGSFTTYEFSSSLINIVAGISSSGKYGCADLLSPEIDITGYSSLVINFITDGTYNVQLIHDGGTKNLSNGTNSISTLKGTAKIRLYCKTGYTGNSDVPYEPSSLAVSKILFKV